MKEKKETRITEIIEAAISEFLEKGYEKASMESIARRANLSKGGLYHHFSSKVDILFAVNMKTMEPITKMTEGTLQQISITEGIKQFTANYINFWHQHQRELSLYFFTMNISFTDKKIMQYYQQFASEIFGFFENLFKQGQEAGIFKIRNARAHTTAFISCIDGFLAYMLIDPSIPVDDIITEIQDTFISDYQTST